VVTPYVLYTDETNDQPKEAVEFFIYGGAWVPADALPDLDRAIGSIRKDAGLKPGDVLKFDSRSRPKYVPAAAHTDAKKRVLGAAYRAGVMFSAAAVLHTIAKRSDWKWQIQADEVLMAFSRFLSENDGAGIVIMDRTATIFDYLQEKSQRGSVNRKSDTGTPLRRLHLFAAGCSGCSSLASVADIVLGSFRYCVNDQADTPATKAMLPAVVKLMWYLVRFDGAPTVRDRGLLLRPQLVTEESYKRKYTQLRQRLEAVIADTPGFEMRPTA
jgi:hypothetical protein